MNHDRSELCPEPLESHRSPRAGVTLIEMLVVVTIIALFAAIVGPRLLQHGSEARVVAAKQQLSAFQLALGQYKLDTGTFPTTEQGLVALRQQPQGAEQWHGPYLEKDLVNDPWGHPYVYKFPGDHGDEPDVISYGADGQPGGADLNADVVSWK
jgi:general secretion pathway protein G